MKLYKIFCIFKYKNDLLLKIRTRWINKTTTTKEKKQWNQVLVESRKPTEGQTRDSLITVLFCPFQLLLSLGDIHRFSLTKLHSVLPLTGPGAYLSWLLCFVENCHGKLV